jgi:N-methylhydantoinase B
MIGSTRIGAEEVAATVRDLGIETALANFEGILDHADRRLRAALAKLPDGVYRAEERFDNDCFEPMDIPLVATLTKSGDRLTVDFTGTAPQIRGFKNSSVANTYSSVYAGIASFFDSDLPRNEGTFRGVTIIAPEGSIVNARPPAPMTMCTVFPAHEIMHMIWWALGQADPERSLAGWGKNSFPNASGRDTDGLTWVMYNWGGNSGAGAAGGRDGFNQMGPMITLGGLTIPNAETYEQLYPVKVRRHELRRDGGGPGRFRGGTGVEYEVDILTDAEYSFRAEGLTRPTGLGVRGGQAGALGTITITEAGQSPRQGPSYGIWRLKAAQLRIESPGGGGVGDPMQRDPERVLRDVRDGLVSPDIAIEVYGVALAADGRSVDQAATARRRADGQSAGRRAANAPAVGVSA